MLQNFNLFVLKNKGLKKLVKEEEGFIKGVTRI
jgi:hypothetical protein